MVRFDCFPSGGELSMMHERHALIVKAPQLAGEEFAVPCKEAGRTSGLVPIERLAFWIRRGIAGCADIVQLRVGIGGHHHDALHVRREARSRQSVAG
jgi:hypothetical protein